MNEQYLKIHRTVHAACKLPDNPDATVRRYTDFLKFESLLRDKALYLCRADRLQDRFEGTYSRKQLLDMDDWLESRGYMKVVDEERQCRIRDRNQIYISCWCLSEYDLDLMWKAYVRNPPDLALKSAVRRFQQVWETAFEVADLTCPLDLG
jgi:hypothetical protein